MLDKYCTNTLFSNPSDPCCVQMLKKMMFNFYPVLPATYTHHQKKLKITHKATMLVRRMYVCESVIEVTLSSFKSGKVRCSYQ